ncbi:YciI family protein [Granulicella sp. dw_53]|uniref:YciI family protein n=1 Tax=Granulicella sp. dw_53 TaxID=2719792 RepID=UPI001BD4E473|nr:YciI family protein [Granulicella sp. dw_53]
MKYICLGYIQLGKFENMSESDRNAMLDECFTYDDGLRKKGHFAGGEALQPPNTAMTVYWKDGRVAVTDGPYAETKEQLGGILVLEARDLNHAIQLISQHPEVKAGPFEIRPAADLSEMIRRANSDVKRTSLNEGGHKGKEIGSWRPRGAPPARSLISATSKLSLGRVGCSPE